MVRQIALAAALVATALLGGMTMPAMAAVDSIQHECQYFKQKAMWTGSAYWWARWRACIRDRDW